MSKRQTLDALQATRATGAALVVFDHCLSALQRNAHATGLDQLAWAFGNVGVYLFFVVSGFVMIYAHERDFGKAGAPARFALRRIGRVVPLYWLFTALAAIDILMVKHQSLDGQSIIFSLFFVPHSGEHFFGEPVLGQGWTLNFEMLFYLVFGMAMAFRRGIGIVFGFFMAMIAAGQAGWFAPDTVMHFWASPITAFFLAGIGLGLIRTRTAWRIGFYQALALAALLVPLAVLVHCVAGDHAPGQIVAGILAITTVAGSVFSNPAPPVRLARVARATGDATYSTYLAHTFLVGALSRVAARLHGGGWPMLAGVVLIGALVSFCVGIVIYEWVERPLLKLWAQATTNQAPSGPADAIGQHFDMRGEDRGPQALT